MLNSPTEQEYMMTEPRYTIAPANPDPTLAIGGCNISIDCMIHLLSNKQLNIRTKCSTNVTSISHLLETFRQTYPSGNIDFDMVTYRNCYQFITIVHGRLEQITLRLKQTAIYAVIMTNMHQCLKAILEFSLIIVGYYRQADPELVAMNDSLIKLYLMYSGENLSTDTTPYDLVKIFHKLKKVSTANIDIYSALKEQSLDPQITDLVNQLRKNLQVMMTLHQKFETDFDLLLQKLNLEK